MSLALACARYLYRFIGINHQHAIDKIVGTVFQQQRCSEYQPCTARTLDLFKHGTANQRMQQGFNLPAGGGIIENPAAQPGAIETAIRGNNSIPELFA